MRLRLILVAALVMCGCSDAPPATGGVDAAAAGPAAGTHYTCPMHPGVHADAPGVCPICNMALTAVGGAADSGAVVVDALRRQHFGVRTEVVQRRNLVREIRAPGTVRWDRSRLLDISVRGDTWIEHLHVLEPGATVRRGQPLALVYNPMLYAAQREFLASRGSERELSKHERLKLLGLSPSQISKLATSGVVSETTELLAPEAGVVVEIEAIEGTHLMEGARFARIARLDRVLVEAEIFEDDVALVSAGAALSVQAPGNAAPITAVVGRIEPWLDPTTRRARVRATVPNPDGLLLPNMYVDVTLRAGLGEQLAVPVEAVIATGQRRIVFVDEGGGRLVPRDVHVGRRAGEWFEVHEGLAAGDAVVTSGAFLVASESRIRASETYWGRAPAHEVSAASGGGH